MRTLTLDIPHSVIKSLLICAGDHDVRYYLNGICLDMRTPGRTHLISTDGHRALIVDGETMFATDDDGETLSVREEGAHYIIPRDLLENVKPAKGGIHKNLNIRVTLSHTDGQPVMCKVAGLTTASGPCLDGRYPEVQRVVPQSTCGEAVQYDPAYVGDFGKIAGLLSGKGKSHYITVGYNGLAAALIGLPSLGRIEAFGLLMPTRTDNALTAAPDWFRAPVDPAQEQAAA